MPEIFQKLSIIIATTKSGFKNNKNYAESEENFKTFLKAEK